MSARVYLMKIVNGSKDVSIISPQDKQWRRTSLLCILQFSCFKYNRMQSKHKQTKCEHTRAKILWIIAFSVGITTLNQRIIKKDDIEFVNEFPCLLGHPVFVNQFHL